MRRSKWRLFLAAPPDPGAPSAGRGGRGTAPGRLGTLRSWGGGAQPSSAHPKPAEARNPLAASAQRRAPPLRASAAIPSRPHSPPLPSPQLHPLQPLVTPKRSRLLTSNLSLSLSLFTQNLTCVSLAANSIVSLRFQCFIVTEWKPGWNRVVSLIKEEAVLSPSRNSVRAFRLPWPHILGVLDLAIHGLCHSHHSLHLGARTAWPWAEKWLLV